MKKDLALNILGNISPELLTSCMTVAVATVFSCQSWSKSAPCFNRQRATSARCPCTHARTSPHCFPELVKKVCNTLIYQNYSSVMLCQLTWFARGFFQRKTYDLLGPQSFCLSKWHVIISDKMTRCCVSAREQFKVVFTFHSKLQNCECHQKRLLYMCCAQQSRFVVFFCWECKRQRNNIFTCLRKI